MMPFARHTASLRTAAAGFVILLGGCAATDPMLDENAWRPTYANEANIAAEVVNPADLVHGRERVDGSDGELAAAAVSRLRAGHVKALPGSGIVDLHGPTSADAP